MPEEIDISNLVDGSLLFTTPITCDSHGPVFENEKYPDGFSGSVRVTVRGLDYEASHVIELKFGLPITTLNVTEQVETRTSTVGAKAAGD